MKRILFISHDVSRTGAPLVLLNIIKWIKQEKPGWMLHILALERGKLEPEFRKNTSEFYDFTNTKRPVKSFEMLADKTLGKAGIMGRNKEERLLDKISRQNFDLIYANSIVSLPVAVKLKDRSPHSRICCHVHELDTIIKMAVPQLEILKNKTDHFIAVSQPVKNNLEDNYQIDPEKISLIHEFGVHSQSLNCRDSRKENFVIGSSGTAHWRKGSDIFLLTAARVYEIEPDSPVLFKWVGSIAGHEEIIREDIRKLGLESRVEFTGELEDPSAVYSEFDLFLLTSREDPFPLVCIEMASHEKPIICFEKASGTVAYVKQGGGVVVPYLDVEKMAKAILNYYHEPDRLKRDGKQNRKIFSGLTKENICPKVLELVSNLLT